MVMKPTWAAKNSVGAASGRRTSMDEPNRDRDRTTDHPRANPHPTTAATANHRPACGLYR